MNFSKPANFEQALAQIQHLTMRIAHDAIAKEGGRPDQISKLHAIGISDDGSMVIELNDNVLPLADGLSALKESDPHLFAPLVANTPAAPMGLGNMPSQTVKIGEVTVTSNLA